MTITLEELTFYLTTVIYKKTIISFVYDDIYTNINFSVDINDKETNDLLFGTRGENRGKVHFDGEAKDLRDEKTGLFEIKTRTIKTTLADLLKINRK